MMDTYEAAAKREREYARECRTNHRARWVVAVRKGNYSAFNGRRFTPSDYSEMRCQAETCGRRWRTKAAYVDTLPDDVR